MLKAEATSAEWNSMTSRKRGMSSGEGMALRRASAMIIPDDDREDEDEDDRRQSLSLGIRPSQEHYDALSRPDAPEIMAEQPEPRSPRSAKSPPAASPFADPKYLERHSGGPTSESQQSQLQQSLRQQRLAYQPSYMRTAQSQPEPQRNPTRLPVPQVQAPRMSDESGNSDSRDDQPSYMRAQQPSSQQQTRPPPPQISHSERPTGPPQSNNPARRDGQSSYMRAAQPPNEDNTSARATPASSHHMNVSQTPQQNRDPSPFRTRIFEQGARLGDLNALYNKPNGSSSSLNHFPPSPKFSHSRSSSRDDGSPWDQQSAYGAQPPPSPRYQMQGESPQSDGRRSSAFGSPASNPYARGSPNEYSPASKGSQGLSAKSPATGVQLQESSSRPGSSGSNRSFPGHSKYFSAPRPPQVQVQVPKSQMGNLQQEQAACAPSSDPVEYRRRPSDNPVAPRATQPQQVRSTANNLRQEDAQRPGSSGSGSALQRPAISPQPTSEGNPAADVAFADFAARVAHMRGVFKLTAEKERPKDRCSPEAWLRTGVWWYLRGKAGLEVLLKNRPRSSRWPAAGASCTTPCRSREGVVDPVGSTRAI